MGTRVSLCQVGVTSMRLCLLVLVLVHNEAEVSFSLLTLSLLTGERPSSIDAVLFVCRLPGRPSRTESRVFGPLEWRGAGWVVWLTLSWCSWEAEVQSWGSDLFKVMPRVSDRMGSRTRSPDPRWLLSRFCFGHMDPRPEASRASIPNLEQMGGVGLGGRRGLG